MPDFNINDTAIVKLLESEGWLIDYYNSKFKFSVSHSDGMCIQNDIMALEFLIEELEDQLNNHTCIPDNALDVSIEIPLSDEEVLEKFDYCIYCESPLEIGCNSDESVLITGMAAKILIDRLRNHL